MLNYSLIYLRPLGPSFVFCFMLTGQSRRPSVMSLSNINLPDINSKFIHIVPRLSGILSPSFAQLIILREYKIISNSTKLETLYAYLLLILINSGSFQLCSLYFQPNNKKMGECSLRFP